MQYKIHTYDDGKLSTTVECDESEEYAYNLFHVLVAMYMKSQKRAGDHAAVVLEYSNDDGEFILAKYVQYAVGQNKIGE